MSTTRYAATIFPSSVPTATISAFLTQPWGSAGPTASVPVRVDQFNGTTGPTAFTYERDTMASPFASFAELEQLAPARFNHGSEANALDGAGRPTLHVSHGNVWKPHAVQIGGQLVPDGAVRRSHPMTP